MNVDPDDIVRAADRIRGLLGVIHDMAHTEDYYEQELLEDHSVVAHVLHENDLLNLLREKAGREEAFEDYQDVAQFLFHHVYMQSVGLAEIASMSICEFVRISEDNLNQALWRMN